MGSPDETTAEGIPTGQPGARKCPRHGCACGGSVRHATPPAPADDASGAEAMRAEFVAHMATVGVTDVAWTNALGPVGTRADHYGVMLSVEWERFAAGYRAALPASDDAVEEAARALCDYLDKTSGGEEWKGSSLVRRLRAALRRENRGDHPQGGHDEGDSPRRGA